MKKTTKIDDLIDFKNKCASSYKNEDGELMEFRNNAGVLEMKHSDFLDEFEPVTLDTFGKWVFQLGELNRLCTALQIHYFFTNDMFKSNFVNACLKE